MIFQEFVRNIYQKLLSEMHSFKDIKQEQVPALFKNHQIWLLERFEMEIFLVEAASSNT